MRKFTEQRLLGRSEKIKRQNVLEETMDRLEMNARWHPEVQLNTHEADQ